jgi:plastocyanin
MLFRYRYTSGDRNFGNTNITYHPQWTNQSTSLHLTSNNNHCTISFHLLYLHSLIIKMVSSTFVAAALSGLPLAFAQYGYPAAPANSQYAASAGAEYSTAASSEYYSSASAEYSAPASAKYTSAASAGYSSSASAEYSAPANSQYYPATNATATTYAVASTGTGSSKPAAQTISVGKDGLKFTPDIITAKVGEEITFQFFPKAHSVVQADFNNPCNPSANGIFSGFVPTMSGVANQTFTITVKDTKPIWLYCSQNKPVPHCQQGMVAVINQPASGPNTLDAFRAAAAGTKSSTSPLTPNGGKITTPSSSSYPGAPGTPSGTSTGGPAESTGAASSLAVTGGAVGAVLALFAGLIM